MALALLLSPASRVSRRLCYRNGFVCLIILALGFEQNIMLPGLGFCAKVLRQDD